MAVKPGTPHPTRKGLVMGKNGSYVSKTTYAKQVKAANAPKQPVTKPVTRSGPVKGPVAKNNSAVRLPNSSRAGVNLPRQGAAGQRQNVTPSKPATKPSKPSKPNPYTSGKPNPNAGGGVKGKPAGGSNALSGYKNDVAALRRLVKAGGPLARQAAKRLAVLGVRVAPGLAIGAALAGSAGRPGAAQMSRLGLSPGRSTRSADAPTYSTPLNKQGNSKAGVNKGPNRVRPTTPYYGPGGASSGSGEGQAQQRKPASKPTASKPTASKPSRQNVTASKPKPKPKPKVSGVGPVASGRSYSVQKTGKSVMQQQADELRAMQERSRKRQEADKKKKPAPRRNTTPRGPRERRYGR